MGIKPKKSIHLSSLAVILLLLFVGCSEKEVGWPRFRGPRGDGISTETKWNPKALEGGAKILWKVDIGPDHSNVVIKDERLYTMGQPSYAELVVYCLDAKTGEEIWKRTFKDTSTGSTLAVDGNSIYGLRPEGVVFSLNAKNGDVQWQNNLLAENEVVRPNYGFSTSPIVVGDLVLLNLNFAGIALDKKTGEMVWISEKYHPSKVCKPPNLVGYAMPVPFDRDGKRYALLFNCTGVHCVNVQTGNELWYHEVFLNSIADPIVFDNRVFISAGGLGGAMCQLINITDNKPKLLWQKDSMQNYFSSSVFVNGYIYGCSGYTESDDSSKIPFSFRCIDAETGDIVWEEIMKHTSVLVADGKLILLEDDGTLRTAEATPSSYQEISRASIYGNENKARQFWTPPVLHDGRIYCRDAHGYLICVDVSNDS